MKKSLKEEVLKKLEMSKDTPVSGQSLAEDLGVSRAAIWKAIDSLRKDGCIIDASSKIGYSLSKSNNFLSKEGIINSLNELSSSKVKEEGILVFDTIDSTNKEAIRLLSSDQITSENLLYSKDINPTFSKSDIDTVLNNSGLLAVIISNEQTKGRGRLGREFESPKDTGLYISLIIKPTFDMTTATLLTTMISVILTRIYKETLKVNPSIKWVNDIYLGEQKVTGILTEGVTNFETGKIDNIIVGIGINCFTSKFSEKAGANPGSLSNMPFSRNELASNIITKVDSLLCSMSQFNLQSPTKLHIDLISEYKENSMILGKKINILNTEKKATAIDIANDGGLVVQYEDGKIETLSSGEVSIRLA